MMVKYILKRTIQYFFSRCFYFFFLFLWYYVRLFQIHLFSIHFFLMILYLVRVKSTPLIVTQSATEQFVQKHSCTSVSHFASNHPLTEEVILTFDQTRFTICNFVYWRVRCKEKLKKRKSRFYSCKYRTERDLWRSPLLFATRHAWSPMEWIFFPVTVLETAIK